ncbi:hypothetical protein HHK36_005727 [Tetracentron sinense]|uniref:Uncharacterized protein n=1 Tax=Tetracentron sinense TaxID=13715 RepID=A0A834ZL32_TETSI|nr:hypothetical protein HHK36_005727 [Tetracentron sinense]
MIDFKIKTFVAEIRFSFVVRSNRYGLLDNDPNFCCGGHHCISFGQNLLQQRTFCKSVPPNIGHYSNCLLLDDALQKVLLVFYAAVIETRGALAQSTNNDFSHLLLVLMLYILPNGLLSEFDECLKFDRWAIVYLAQMKPLIVPILSEGE